MLGQTLRMKKKRVTHPSKAPWDTQILFCDKNTLLQRGSVYTKKLKRLIGQAGWLTDWLTDWESKQADSYILLHTALKHWSAFWREGVCVALWYYHIYVGSVHFWRFKILNYIFCRGWGGGGGGQEIRKINMFGDMMKLWFIFCTFWGVISINLGFFKVNVQIWKMFLWSLKFEYVLGMPDIPYILGVKSRCWVQCQA